MSINTCTVELQVKILDAVDLYFMGQKDSFSGISDINNYIADKFNLKDFTFSDVYGSFTSDNKNVLNEIFYDHIGRPSSDFISEAGPTVVLTKNNIQGNFTSIEINDLFHTLPIAKDFFEGQMNNKVVTKIIIGDRSEKTYVADDSSLTKNLNNLKGELFNTIQDFLITRNLLEKKEATDLYDNKGNLVNYDDYKAVMGAIDNYFFKSNNFDLITSYSKKMVPNIKGSLDGERSMYEVYNAAIMLNNFDTILNKYFSGLVTVDYKSFNNLVSNLDVENKYNLKIKGLETIYWNNDTHESEGVENSEDKLTKLLVSIIPLYNKKSERQTNFLEMKDFYLFSAKLANFELQHGNRLRIEGTNNFKYFNQEPREAISWYIREISNALLDKKGSIKELKNEFYSNSEFIISLDKFLKSEELNIETKEANTEGTSFIGILGQIINNSYGASYLKYNSNGNYTVQEMYKYNANNIQTQNALFSTIAKQPGTNPYDLIKNTKETARFNKIFEALDGEENIAKIGIPNKIEIGKYIKSKTGISVNLASFNDLVLSLKGDDKTAILSVERFKSHLSTMISKINSDYAGIVAEVEKVKKAPASTEDSTIGQFMPNTLASQFFKSLQESYLVNFIIKPVMTIETLSGESLPTFKTANLTYKDTELFEQQREFEKAGGHFRSLLTDKNAVILGTGTKLEAVNGWENKSAFKFSVSESYVSNFEFDFLKAIKDITSDDSGKPWKKFSITLGNYSDKNTVLTKIIDGFAKDRDGNTIIEMKNDDLLKLVKSQSLNYYTDVFNNIFSTYKTMFDALGIENKIRGSNFGLTDFNNNVKEINSILRNNNIHDLNRKYSAIKEQKDAEFEPNYYALTAKEGELPDLLPKLDLTEELHYSSYEKKSALNQLLIDNYRIFSNDDNFNKFVKIQEDSLASKFNTFNKNFNNKLNLVNKDSINDYAKALGLPRGDEQAGGKLIDYNYIKDSNGELNPMLKKWQWVNALYRNEYMYISAKGEYMHPHKSDLQYRGDSSDINWEDLQKEMSGRLTSMAKRNVLFTATIEAPARNTKRGVPENINMAVLEDHKAELYNYSGNVKNQEVHDGSSFIDYTYGLMLDASFPGKGYSGTKKQFGTLITANGVTIKKDSETIITNDKIRNSFNSEINFLGKKKQMLGLQLNFDNNFSASKAYTDEYFYNHLNEIYRINNVSLINNLLTVTKSKKTETGYINIKPVSKHVNNLFEIWQELGGHDSSDEKGNFNEGSNELLFDLITSKDSVGNYPLKDKIIHIISNKSAVKAGSINLNAIIKNTDGTIQNPWKNSDPLLYSTYKGRFMGPQLDANHTADSSQIKEITQVISALAQNGSTSDLATEAYQDIANVIKKSAAPYLKYMIPRVTKVINGQEVEVEGTIAKDDLYKYIAGKFINTVLNSKGNNLTKTLLESFSSDVKGSFGDAKIPFSNQNFFQQFVRDIITRMNNEFITRYYSGIGAILNPSHGIIQLYEDSSGNIHTQADVYKKAIKEYDPNKYLPGVINNNIDIFNKHIEENFKPIDTTRGKIQLGDTVIEDGKQIQLNTLKKYYEFKENGSRNSPIQKVISVARDLKPSEITFDSEHTIHGTVNRNIFDLDSVRLRYHLNDLMEVRDALAKAQTKGMNLLNAVNNTISRSVSYDLLNQFNTHFGNTLNIDNESFNKLSLDDQNKVVDKLLNNYFTTSIKYLTKWTQRNLDLIKDGMVMKSILDTNEFLIEHTGRTNFDKYFGKLNEGGDTLVNDIYSDVKDHYIQNNHLNISNYKFKAAELILPDLYASKFRRGDHDSMSKIIEQGAEYFKNKLRQDFIPENRDKVIDNFKYDAKLVVDGLENPIYIRYTNNLPSYNSSNFLIKTDWDKNENYTNNSGTSGFTRKLSRVDTFGNKIYELPDEENMRIVEEYGKEVVLLYGYNTSEKKNIKYKYLNDNLSKFVKSFKGHITAFIPLMENNISYNKAGQKFSLNDTTLREFKKFSGYMGEDHVNNNWLNNTREDIINQLGNKMYASWQKSHEFVAARIPSQSMQSFMEMKNVAYFNTKSNDAYVSIYQIWLQGSDFDIDKAYIIGSGFDNNSQFNLWSNLSSYSTKGQLDALEKLPIPTGKKAQLDPNGIDVTNEFDKISEILKLNGTAGKDILSENDEVEGPENIKELSEESINSFNQAIRKINNSNEIFSINSADVVGVKWFTDMINNHNNYKEYLYQDNSVKNSIISRIKQIISDPRNQLLANEPVDVEGWQQAAKEAQSKNPTKPMLLSSYDMFSMFKQQRDAAVGKDDVGISANGLKGLFALSTYYNDIYTKQLKPQTKEDVTMDLMARGIFDTNQHELAYNLILENLRRANSTFFKSFSYYNREGELKTLSTATISDTLMSRKQKSMVVNALGKEFTLMKSDAAISASGFTSAATDNAKELLMAKINASVDLAPMHLYMITLGYSKEDIADFMTSSIAERVLDGLESNIFYTSDTPKVGSVIGDIIRGAKDNPQERLNAETFRSIYQGSQEMNILSRILGVNQKTSANIKEINSFLSNFQQLVFSRESSVFGFDLIPLKNLYDSEINQTKDFSKQRDSIIGKILEVNGQLDSIKDRDYIIKTLRNAGHVEVWYTDDNGERQSKYVSLLGGEFDFRHYIDKDNGEYKKAAIEYYNLIKNTINVFDVIDNVPHFKEMVSGLVLSHNILNNMSVKYNFVFNQLIDVVKSESRKIVFSKDSGLNNWIQNQMGNPGFPIKIGDKEISKACLYIDRMLVEVWLKQNVSNKLTFNVNELLRQTKLKIGELDNKPETIEMYTSNDARSSSLNSSANKVIVSSDSDSNFIVSLDTNYGIANFKRLMEQIILPYLQRNSNRTLVESLKVEARNNIFGIRGDVITSTFPLGQMSNPINAARFKDLTTEFNALDLSSNSIPKIQDFQQKDLMWRDLFYTYNLIVNNEKYGDTRLTALFEDYMKEPTSLGYDYLLFSSKLDGKNINLLDYKSRINQDVLDNYTDPVEKEAKRNQLINQARQELYNDILFYTFNDKGKLSIQLGSGNPKNLMIDNPDFTIVSSLSATAAEKREFEKINNIIRLIKSNGFIIKFKC